MRVGTCFGIPLKVNPFFILLLTAAFLFGRLGEAVILFAIVLWHESFHVLVARIHGLVVLDVELLPFGGVARLDVLLQLNPQIEWLVAAVGPLSNVLLIFAGLALFPHFDVDQHWFDFFIRANFGMAVFNLLPALPLDGGRVLRSILVKNRGFREATRLATRFGQFLGVALLGWGGYLVFLEQYAGLVFVFSGIMLYWSALLEQRNSSYVFMRYLTQKHQEMRLKKIWDVNALAVTVEAPLGELLKKFRPPHYHLVWVLDLNGRVVGSIGELELIRAVFEQGLSCRVGDLVS